MQETCGDQGRYNNIYGVYKKAYLWVDSYQGEMRAALIHIRKGTVISFVLDIVANTRTAIREVQINGEGSVDTTGHCLLHQRADFVKPWVRM